MALGFRQRMAERGLHVTEDMQVIGYDNILRRFGLGLRMTTVEQSVVDLAAAGWGMLGSRIDAVVRGDGDSGVGRPWLASPQVKVLTPKLVQALAHNAHSACDACIAYYACNVGRVSEKGAVFRRDTHVERMIWKS